MSNAKNRLNVVIWMPAATIHSRRVPVALVPTGNTDGLPRSDGASGLAPVESSGRYLITFAAAPIGLPLTAVGK